MNTVSISGHVQGDGELRVTRDGRRILNFIVGIEGEGEPYVPIGYLLGQSEALPLHAGERVFVEGRLKTHRVRGLFLAAKKIKCSIREAEKNRVPRPRTVRQLTIPRPMTKEALQVRLLKDCRFFDLSSKHPRPGRTRPRKERGEV